MHAQGSFVDDIVRGVSVIGRLIAAGWHDCGRFLQHVLSRFIKAFGLVRREELDAVRSVAAEVHQRQVIIEERLIRMALEVEKFRILKDPSAARSSVAND